jgi:glycosyltransferase involved in cell wall biosynthesis
VNSELSYTAVLCSYNAEQTVREAIKSILDQSIMFEELIIIDDCSTDSTVSLISKFTVNDSKIIFIQNSYNVGQAASRNIASKFATGEVLIFFDDDDTSNNLRAENHLLLHEKGADITFVSSLKAYSNGYKTEFKNNQVENLTLINIDWVHKLLLGKSDSLIQNLSVPTSTCSVLKSAFVRIGGFDENFRRLEDIEFFLKLVLAGGTSSWSPRILVTRKATYSSDKGGNIDSTYEKILIEKYSEYLSKKLYNLAISKNRIRNAYFAKSRFEFLIYICRPNTLALAISNPIYIIVGLKRLLHDLRKGKS